MSSCTCGLVAMTSASHAEGRQFDPGQVYIFEFIFAAKPQNRTLAQNTSELLKQCNENKQPPVGFEPTTSRLLSGCSAN